MEKLVTLAPMAGYSDISFREICSEFKVDYTVTEMISAKALINKDKKTRSMLEISPKEKNVVVQIFGDDPDICGEAARILNEYNFKMIDINMGCPAPKIVKNNQGSALLKDKYLIYKIVREVVRNSNVEVSVKIRKSIDGINSLDAAREIERAGASLITVHGRSREEFYTGKSDWNFIREVKDALNIKVLGNGDIVDFKRDYEKIKNSGVDGVAIGRGAIGNPFIFSEFKNGLNGREIEYPSDKTRLLTLIDHINRSVKYKGEKLATIQMRKHYSYYFKNMYDSKEIRNKLNTIKDYREAIKLIENFIDYIDK